MSVDPVALRQAPLPEEVLPLSRHASPVLAVPAPLCDLFPGGGIRPGALVAVTGSTSLLLTLLATASSNGTTGEGRWCAAVGFPSLGALAAAELGIALERFAVVGDPGPQWPTVTAALFDGMELVALCPPARARPADLRRLTARARARRVALLVTGPVDGAEVRLHAERTWWEGLGEGHGRLRERSVEVSVTGRGGAGRERRVTLHLGDRHRDPPPPSVVHFGRAS